MSFYKRAGAASFLAALLLLSEGNAANLRGRPDADFTEGTQQAVSNSFAVLSAELASGERHDFQVQAGTVLLPYYPREASLALTGILDDVHFSSATINETTDTLAGYLSPALLRRTRHVAQESSPSPRWALRLMSYSPRPSDISVMERYFLSGIADPEMIRVLRAYDLAAKDLLLRLMHRSPRESCYAAWVLTGMGEIDHYSVMEDYGADNLCLALTLAEVAPHRGRTLVLAHLRSGDEEDRRRAAYALGPLSDSSYIPYLYLLLCDPDTVVAANAAFSLGFYGDTTGAAVLRQLADDTLGDVGLRIQGLLSALPASLTRPVLYQLVSQDRDMSVIRAAQALGARSDTAAVPYLVPLLSSGNRRIQQAAIQALGRIGDASVRADIRPFLDGENLVLAVEAAKALGDLADSSIVNRLSLMLFWEPGPYNQELWVRHPIVEALAAIGDTSCLDALALCLDDPDPFLAVKVLDFFSRSATASHIPYVEPLLDHHLPPVRIKAAQAILAMSQKPSPEDTPVYRGEEIPSRDVGMAGD